ncbi:MAG TPA: CotH kinase family protein [Kofleriaceae bacterium]|nr:CotH kinase family protein [Kofleriaceae bacterium]
MNRLARLASISLVPLAAALALAACGEVPPAPAGDDDGVVPPDAGPRPDAPAPDAPPPIDAGPDAPVTTVDPAIDGRLVINEFMPADAFTFMSGPGAGSDWLEIFNPTDTALSLQGYGVTDDLAQPRKVVVGAVMVPARGRVLLWADHHPAMGPDHLDLALDADGGDVGLARPDGSFIDRVHYGKQATDFSLAREPDGSDHWVTEWQPTPDAANAAGPGQPMGLEDPTMPPEQVPDAGDLTDQVLGYDELPQFALQLDDAAANALRADPRTYVPAMLTFRGRTVGPVGLRLKGSNSFEPFDEKPSFKINMNEYVDGGELWGIDLLTLDNMSSDYSMMHERLAYWVARGVHLPASRCNHATVVVNGASYGLYANVESVKHSLLKRWFADASGPLYEGTDVDFAAQYLAAFDLEAGMDDRTMLVGLANALTIDDPDQALAAASAFVDLDQFRRFWAMEAVIGQFDALPYSFPGDDFHVYADPTHGLSFLPWGMDETFYSGDVDPSMPGELLASKCRASAACFQAWVDDVWDVLSATESMNLAGERDRVIAQIAPLVSADQRKPYTDADVAMYQGALYWFIHDRRMQLASWLPPRTP